MAAVQSITPDLVLDYEQIHKGATVVRNVAAKGAGSPLKQIDSRQTNTKANVSRLHAVTVT